MEINLNCDLGEKSKYYNGANDLELINIINTANIACGYHAGSKSVIEETIKMAKKKNVSIGAHPGFADKKNFGRKRQNIGNKELQKLIIEQLIIMRDISNKQKWPMTHVKPHGALNNMACEDYDVAYTIGECIRNFDKELIYLVLPFSEMEKAAQRLNLKYACEIFADRNYDDNGFLVSREDTNALVDDPEVASENILEMLSTSSIKTLSGKKLKCYIDSICIHGDNHNAIFIAKKIIKNLKVNNINLINLNELKKFK